MIDRYNDQETKIMKKFLLIIILGISMIVAACAPISVPGSGTAVPTVYPAPIKSPTEYAYPAKPPVGNATQPSYPGPPKVVLTVSPSPSPQSKGGSEMEKGPVFIDRQELIRATSGVNEYQIRLAGNKPTPCHEVQYNINPPDKNNRIQVNVYTIIKPGQICAQVLAPFTITINIGKLSAGSFSVFVNDAKLGDIKIP